MQWAMARGLEESTGRVGAAVLSRFLSDMFHRVQLAAVSALVANASHSHDQQHQPSHIKPQIRIEQTEPTRATDDAFEQIGLGQIPAAKGNREPANRYILAVTKVVVMGACCHRRKSKPIPSSLRVNMKGTRKAGRQDLHAATSWGRVWLATGNGGGGKGGERGG